MALSVAGKEFPPVEVVIDPDRVAAFARSLGADPADGVPPTYAAVYTWDATAHQIFGDPDSRIDLQKLLHTDHEFEWARQPRVGETVVARSRIAADVFRRGIRFLTVETDVTAAGEPLCRSTARLLIRNGGE
jgi:N-terminal half of MaoC dehydratase